MLPWLPKKLRKRTLFFSELLIFSTGIHFIVGLVLFVLYRGQYESFSFEVRSKSKDQLVLFLPHRHFSRSAAYQSQGQKKVGMKNINSPQRRRGTPRHATTFSPKKAQQKSSKTAHAENKKIVQKPATMFLDKQTSKSKHAANEKDKKSKMKKADRKMQPVAATQIPKEVIEEKKREEIKVPVPDVQAALSREINKAEQIEPDESAPPEQTAEQTSDMPESFDIAVGNDADNDADCGDEQSPELSPEAARIYYMVQEEIATHWKPPSGLAKDLVCTIGVRLDREGTIADVTVKKSSGVLIYDLSASNAVQEMQLPRMAWGKEFSIAFRL